MIDHDTELYFWREKSERQKRSLVAGLLIFSIAAIASWWLWR